MCGISGIYGLRDEFRMKDILVHMNTAMAHRGPDDQGIFTRSGIGLGHRRLSIIDLSAEGKQPMLNASGTVALAFNGEIYNYRQLKAGCRNYEFRTQTDSEVILALYEQHGETCFSMLDGMFAIAIWDERNKKLILARDRMGKKPLYYSWAGEVLVFASEIRSLMASGLVQPKLDQGQLSCYVQFQTVYAPATIVRDVQMLEAGTVLNIQNHIQDRKKFWNIEQARQKYSLTGPYDKVVKQTRELFFAAVEKRMISDVPLGAFLSGGVDSSSVVAAMSAVSSGKVKTFNICFDDSEFSEAVYAREIADLYRTEHHEILVRAEDFLNNVTDGLNATDHPGTDGLNTFVVSRYTKQAGITVALSGLGGDEVFGGYPVFRYMQKWQKFRFLGKVPFGVRKQMISAAAKRAGTAQTTRMMQIAESKKWSWQEIYPVFRMVLTNREMEQFGFPPYRFNVSETRDAFGDKLISEISAEECKTYLENILLRDADQMSMASALEVRVPFLDKDLIEFVFSLPDDFKPLKPGKKLLIDAMGKDLPESVWNRKKMGFTFPWKKWVNHELKDLCLNNLNFLEQQAVIPSLYIKQLKTSLDLPENPYWHRVWNLTVLGYWMQKNHIQID